MHNRLFKTVEQQQADRIRAAKQAVKREYLQNRKKMTKEILESLLPQLETKLDSNDHSHAQYNSLILFLELCTLYRDMLPKSFNEYKDPKILFDRYTALKNSKWFRTTPDKDFINRQLEKYKPQLSTDKPMEESKEEAKEQQLVESFAKFKY